jgi:phosphoribosylaminoimidazolecarboxamide formyltransferase/IMP cyclohydrolase
MIRQIVDIGGPTMAQNARKAWVSTALLTDPREYPAFIRDVRQHRGCVSLSLRLHLVKQASARIAHYMQMVDECIQAFELAEIEQTYAIANAQ